MMTLRSFFRPSALADYLGRHTLLFATVLFVIGIVVVLWTPLNAAEPGTSDPSDITHDAVASLEAAKAELAPKLDELQAEEMRLKGEIEGTIGDCRQIRVEYIMASGGKIGAEGAVRTLEEVSRDPKVAELVSDKLEEARLLVTVHETEMGKAIARAEAVEGEQNTLLARRLEVETEIRGIKVSIATLDEAIRELKLTTSPRYRVAVLDPDWSYPSPPRDSRRKAVPAETIADPPQIVACMVAGDL